MSQQRSFLAAVNGTVSLATEATIPISDEGLLRGDGVFEVVLLIDGRPFLLAEHLKRLATSAGLLKLPVDTKLLESEITALLQQSKVDSGLLRIVCTRSGNRVLLIEPPLAVPASIALLTVQYQPSILLNQVKSLSYAANMLARRTAQEGGYDDALFVTPDGEILEGPTWSLFWVTNGVAHTPHLNGQILPSITRQLLLEDMTVIERPAYLHDLVSATEAFIVSTNHNATPVTRLNQQVFSTGPVAQQARQLLLQRQATTVS